MGKLHFIFAGMFFICAVFGDARISYAQTSTTNFRFAEPNELTIIVNVLGAVARPGRYEISRSIDLVNLIALAGGTLDGADLDNIKITRVVKTGSIIEKKEVKVDINNLAKVNEGSLLLFSGDVIFVDRSTWASVSNVLTVFTAAAVVTTAVVSVINQTRPR